MGLVGVTELSDAQKKQLKEQQEVRPEGGVGSTPAGGRLSPPPHLWCSDHTVNRETPGQAGSPSTACQPQPAAGPRAQASSCFPVIPHGQCLIATPYRTCGLFPLSSLKFFIQFPLVCSPGQAWLALDALSDMRTTQLVLGNIGVRVGSASLLLPWGTRGIGLSVLGDASPWGHLLHAIRPVTSPLTFPGVGSPSCLHSVFDDDGAQF